MSKYELIIGLVGARKIDLAKIRQKLESQFSKTSYALEYLTVSDLLTKNKKKPVKTLSASPKVYIVYPIQTITEIEALSRIYGKNFIIISILSENDEADHHHLSHYGHYFIHKNRKEEKQIDRFIRLLFSDPFVDPTIEECAMFYAQNAAYRSLDIDRQVGAAIMNLENELISIGFNDVCKAGGGHYSEKDKAIDDRDYKKEIDYNHQKLEKISKELTKKISKHFKMGKKELGEIQTIVQTKIACFTEYKRSTHAEMSALLDASRRGISIKGCVLYVNKFPCHNCAKHIIAAGISKVVYLDPYEKSEAMKMYHKLISANKKEKSKIYFKPFFGLAPNRFVDFFQHDKFARQERDKNGKLNGKPKKWKLSKESTPKFL